MKTPRKKWEPIRKRLPSESYWNNRVVRHTAEHPNGGTTTSWLAIHEAFYESGARTPNSITRDPITIIGDNVKEVRQTLLRMLRALKKPALRYEKYVK